MVPERSGYEPTRISLYASLWVNSEAWLVDHWDGATDFRDLVRSQYNRKNTLIIPSLELQRILDRADAISNTYCVETTICIKSVTMRECVSRSVSQPNPPVAMSPTIEWQS